MRLAFALDGAPLVGKLITESHRGLLGGVQEVLRLFAGVPEIHGAPRFKAPAIAGAECLLIYFRGFLLRQSPDGFGIP